MSELDPAQVERVRQVVIACGGWNRRSRGALLAWARAEAVDDERLERLLAKALEVRVPPAPSRLAAPTATVRPTVSQPALRPRWWLAVMACAGIASSVWLFARLAPRMQETPAPARPTVAQPAVAAPARSLPPPPVSFPSAPQIAPPERVVEAAAPAPLGERPAGELSRAVVQAWADAFEASARAWPSMQPGDRQVALASLAAWVAVGGGADLQAIRDAQRRLVERLSPRDRMLADAFAAMLVAEVATSPRISSAVAADAAFAGPARLDASRALDAWASAELPRLTADLGAPDARERWSGWLQAVGAISTPRQRVALALAAIDSILRGDARLDGQGLAADALGSLLAGVPSDPSQPGFDDVRGAWVAWLRDARVPSARLWALGGIWRARGEAPDAWLLPGERDGTPARVALADRWSRLDAARNAPVWQPLLAQLRRPVPRAVDARLAARLDDLAARVLLARSAESTSTTIPKPTPEVPQASRPTPRTVEPRWAAALTDVAPETRQKALREIRSEAPDALAPADAGALAARAIGAQSKDERQLAQEIVRGPLAESAVMRDAIAREVATCADPRLVGDFLERILGTDLPADDAQSLRAAALSHLLQVVEPEGEVRESRAAIARLAGTMRAWCGDGCGDDSTDPADAAWALANRACVEAAGLRPPEIVQPLVSGLGERARRLARRAPDGPRGFAAALALLCDARAARLAVQHAGAAPSLRRLADAASDERARAGDSLQQAAISLEAIASMHLLVEGAPVPIDSSEPVGQAEARPASRAAALAELDRADAVLASSPGDRKRLAGALRHAVMLDSAVAGRAALALAQAETEAARRSYQLEAAALLGEGAALPPTPAFDTADGIALAQLLAWSERGQVDRLVAAKLPERFRPALTRFAAASNSSVEECLAALRQPGSGARSNLCDRLRAAALRALDARAAGWLGAIAAGEAGPLPEGDAGQPWRFRIPGG